MNRYTILSDLHIGAGDSLDDFLFWGPLDNGPSPAERPGAMRRMDESFHLFLLQENQMAHEAGCVPHLLLLGDICDLWQVRRHREKYADALLRILQAHPKLFAALREWTGSGGEVTYVLGNHDQPLVDEDAWALLRHVIPTINRTRGGGPIHYFADEASGLYAEHGHQWDPFNRMRNLQKAGADCAGHRIVRYVVNRLEPVVPLIDKGADLLDLLQLLWRAGETGGFIPWREIVVHLVRLVGRASAPACLLAEELGKFLTCSDHPPDFGAVAERQEEVRNRALGRVLKRKAGATIGPLPVNFRYLASGHTHLPGMAESHGILQLNPGTWRPIVRRPTRPITISQKLTYFTVEPVDGKWVSELKEWEREA